jgi:hypothetical protein
MGEESEQNISSLIDEEEGRAVSSIGGL